MGNLGNSNMYSETSGSSKYGQNFSSFTANILKDNQIDPRMISAGRDRSGKNPNKPKNQSQYKSSQVFQASKNKPPSRNGGTGFKRPSNAPIGRPSNEFDERNKYGDGAV